MGVSDWMVSSLGLLTIVSGVLEGWFITKNGWESGRKLSGFSSIIFGLVVILYAFGFR